MNYKQYITENTSRLSFSPQHIYDLYYISSVQHNLGLDKYDEFIINEKLEEIKNDYLQAYKILIVRQIEKYIRRERYEGDLSVSNDDTFEQLFEKMKQTFRSDMTRKNTRWEMLCEKLVELEQSNKKNIINIIDRINNLTHNTTTMILDKFDNANELLRAFDKVHYAKTSKDFVGYVSKDIRQL